MSSSTSSSPQESVRRQNLGALLRYIHVRGATSRAELTTRLGLNRSTIGALTADLATAGLIDEGVPQETGRAGRPSIVVRPRSSRVYGYALSLELDRLRAARVGLGGRILDDRSAARPAGTDPAPTVAALAALVADMQRTARGGAAGPDGAACVGSALAVSASVRHHLGWADETIESALAPALTPHTGAAAGPFVGGLADLAALAEHTRGAAAGADNVIYLHGDAGISAGIIAGGRRITGYGGHGGEVGHMVVNPGGRLCGCGSRGCWETEIGERALLHLAGRAVPTAGAAVAATVLAARDGDEHARAAVVHAADWLGFGVANLVNIFNPTVVVFGGTLRELYVSGADEVRHRLYTMALPACRAHVALHTPQLGADAALVGAAELAFEPLLTDPLYAVKP
ncbi:ROK family protein [Dactylosporangium vinaceum]|uniref:ROK family protein n=1 Tax=Dactylosporangium vinaceum TaxID=53362 RepID=A0ABV5LZS8_9ACTN|nr:ROK family transcriptional regulator [Dactylosporangium vinaceum]UAB94388.1 ROK family protein [Dactylosporangium vinaceum]